MSCNQGTTEFMKSALNTVKCICKNTCSTCTSQKQQSCIEVTKTIVTRTITTTIQDNLERDNASHWLLL